MKFEIGGYVKRNWYGFEKFALYKIISINGTRLTLDLVCDYDSLDKKFTTNRDCDMFKDVSVIYEQQFKVINDGGINEGKPYLEYLGKIDSDRIDDILMVAVI